MVNYERIAAEAAELARQFWLEIEAEFTQHTVRCQADLPAQAPTPGDPHPRDAATWPGWPARPAAPADQPAAPERPVVGLGTGGAYSARPNQS